MFLSNATIFVDTARLLGMKNNDTANPELELRCLAEEFLCSNPKAAERYHHDRKHIDFSYMNNDANKGK